MNHKHGHAKRDAVSRTYRSWKAAMQRCYKTTDQAYARYGGRGIRVCAAWHDFAVFLSTMGDRPPGASLDRIDVNGHYEPGNTRWANATTQSRNRRSNKLDAVSASQIRWLRHDGGFSAREIAEAFGVSRATINRVLSGEIWA